jgi:hypothetical protein
MQHKGSVPEFVFIRMKNGKYLFLASIDAVLFIKQQYTITDENVADMRSIHEEPMIDGKKGLLKFTNILEQLSDLGDNILIHCKQGLNRTPVAAAIFLVTKMKYSPEDAQTAVESAMRLRKQDYTLDELGCYRAALLEAAGRHERSREQHFYKPRQRGREVDEITRQKNIWYQ